MTLHTFVRSLSSQEVKSRHDRHAGHNNHETMNPAIRKISGDADSARQQRAVEIKYRRK